MKHLERRAYLYQIALVACFLLLAGRLGLVQVVQGARWASISEGNSIRILPIVAPRGTMFDREGEPLASSRPAYHVSLLPMDRKPADATLTLLGELLGMTLAEVKREIAESKSLPYEPIRVKTDISPQEHTRIEERRAELPGVIVEVGPIRQYLYDTLASHVLGHIGKVDNRGRYGLEVMYDQYLTGENGGRQIEVDSRHRPTGRVLPKVDAVPGNNLVLTLDLSLQRVAEEALGQAMQAVRERPTKPYPNAKSGAVVALHIPTGEVLVMASVPAFDPNLFAVGDRRVRELELDPLKPFLNRAIKGLYQPGSTFKMVTAVAGLAEQKVTLAERVFCSGVYTLVPKKCWEPHGWVDFHTAIAVSCNTYFFELGYRVSADPLAVYARGLGLGAKTGIDLPGEEAGIVPDVDWKRRNVPRDPQWWLAETLDAAIGQGFHIYTPLQLASYTATLASGVQMQPHLVKRVISPRGEILLEIEPQELGRPAISQAVLAEVKQGMRAVTAPGGTAAWRFWDFPIAVAGKTGTAQNSHGDNHGLFVAYAPVDAPEIAVAVVVEQGGSGSAAGAPVAWAIFAQYFGLRKISPPVPTAPAD
ncbi:MAG: penicillin-binding protein 2 [Bacillota bacterium]